MRYYERECDPEEVIYICCSNCKALQLLRSGTAIGALVREAQNAESKSDFVHKLSVAQKECDETGYWLELLNETRMLSQKQYDDIYQDATELLKIIRSIILSIKQKM